MVTPRRRAAIYGMGSLAVVSVWLIWVALSYGGILLVNWLPGSSPSIGTAIVAGLIWLVCAPGALAGIVGLVPAVIMGAAFGNLGAVVGLLGGIALSIVIIFWWVSSSAGSS